MGGLKDYQGLLCCPHVAKEAIDEGLRNEMSNTLKMHDLTNEFVFCSVVATEGLDICH